MFRLIVIAFLLFVFSLVSPHFHFLKSWQLPTAIQNKDLLVKGIITAIPEYQNGPAHFEFKVTQFLNPQTPISHPIKIKLNWYQSSSDLKVGDEWQLTVRLKSNAVGYVKSNPANNILLKHDPWRSPIDQFRQKLAHVISADLGESPLYGLITALSVGIRDGVSEDQWQVMRATGTNHLFAIAGLHIGFVTAMIFFMTRLLWSQSVFLCLRLPAQEAGAFFSLSGAVFYSALAGFSLPTQRALIMITVYLFTTLLRRNISKWNAFFLALIVVLLLDPNSITSPSFWLSFGAVALIIYGISGRFRKQSFLWRWMRIQWVLAVGLIPLGILFFQQSSLIGFIANAIAIPWIGFVVLPLCLLGVLAWFIFPVISSCIFLVAGRALQLIWQVLSYLSQQNGLQWHTAISAYWIFAAACIAIILLLAPRGFPARYLWLVGCLPLLFWIPPSPKPNEIWITVFNAGQGSAVIIHTQNHVLLYDAGARANGGDSMLSRFLINAHIKSIDQLVISQTDSSHAGGAGDLLAQFPVKHIFTTLPSLFVPGMATPCAAGQNWQWDGVNFHVLSPVVNQKFSLSNSCVLQIDNNHNFILLTDGLTSKTATDLLPLNLLQMNVLIAPINQSENIKVLRLLHMLNPEYFMVTSNSRSNTQTILGLRSVLYSGGVITLKISNDPRILFADARMERVKRAEYGKAILN